MGACWRSRGSSWGGGLEQFSLSYPFCWALLGALLGPSWSVLGWAVLWPTVAVSGPSRGLLGPSWSVLGGLLGRLGAILGASWARLELWKPAKARTLKPSNNLNKINDFGNHEALLGDLLELSWLVWEGSWAARRPSWAGPSRRHLGPPGGVILAFLACFGAILGEATVQRPCDEPFGVRSNSSNFVVCALKIRTSSQSTLRTARALGHSTTC